MCIRGIGLYSAFVILSIESFIQNGYIGDKLNKWLLFGKIILTSCLQYIELYIHTYTDCIVSEMFNPNITNRIECSK